MTDRPAEPSPSREANLADATLAAAVECERAGRHYSNGEGVMVIEISTARLMAIIQNALDRFAAAQVTLDLKLSAAALARLVIERHRTSSRLLTNTDWEDLQRDIAKTIAAALVAGRRAALEAVETEITRLWFERSTDGEGPELDDVIEHVQALAPQTNTPGEG